MPNHRAPQAVEQHRGDGQFATFYVHGLYFGIGVLEVQEILRHQEMTRVPLAPGVIEGLINLRGQIITAIDMRQRLELPRRGEDEGAMNIVVRAQDGAVSLLVDDIGDVLELDQQTFERPPDNMAPAALKLIRGIHKLEDQLLLILDTDKAVELRSGDIAA